MGKGYKYIPAVPAPWIKEMLQGVINQRVKATASTVAVIQAMNTAYCIQNRSAEITLPHNLLEVFLVSRQTAITTLKLLEKAGLVKLEYKAGCSTKITLLHPPPALKRRGPL